MSSGTPNCWTMCPWGHVTILLAVPSGQGPCWLCVPYSWPWLTRQALLREPAGRHVSPGRGRWPRQGAGGYRLGHTVTQDPACAQPAPAAGTRTTLRHLGLTGSPHQPRRGQRQRLGRFLRVSFCFSKSFHIRGTLRGAGGAEEVPTPPWARACRSLVP